MIHAVQLGQGTHQWNVSIAHLQKIVEVCIPSRYLVKQPLSE
jgi:hypothetical protein